MNPSELNGKEKLNKNTVIVNKFQRFDQDHVNSYIADLAHDCQKAYNDYITKHAEYNELLEQFQALEQNQPNPDINKESLVDIDAKAQKIIADAQAEADKILADARIEADKNKLYASVEKAAAKLQAQKILADAHADAAKIKKAAQKILYNAGIDAAVTKNKFLPVDSAPPTGLHTDHRL